MISWRIVVHEVPTDPLDMCDYLKHRDIEYALYARETDDSLIQINSIHSNDCYPRLVYLITKK